MSTLRIVVLLLVGGCHLVIPHAPPAPGRDAAEERATLDTQALDLARGADLAPADLSSDGRPDRSRDQREPDLVPVVGKSCQNGAKTALFTADPLPTPGATIALTVCAENPPSTTWIMAGVKANLADGKGTCCPGCYVGQVQTFNCPGYSNGWKIDGIKVPASGGPYAFSLLADCVGDSCSHSTCKELAWCKP